MQHTFRLLATHIVQNISNDALGVLKRDQAVELVLAALHAVYEDGLAEGLEAMRP